jgi:hypothetical protein
VEATHEAQAGAAPASWPAGLSRSGTWEGRILQSTSTHSVGFLEPSSEPLWDVPRLRTRRSLIRWSFGSGAPAMLTSDWGFAVGRGLSPRVRASGFVLLAVEFVLQAGCGSSCPAGYYELFTLPATVKVSPCTLSISGPAGTFQYSLPPSATNCAPLGAAPPVSCSRDPPAADGSETVGVIVASDVVAVFEQSVGGSSFTLSITCGTASILDRDPQSMGTICEE